MKFNISKYAYFGSRPDRFKNTKALDFQGLFIFLSILNSLIVFR